MADGYSYSTANKTSGVIWGEDTLFDYLLAPKKYIKVSCSTRHLTRPRSPPTASPPTFSLTH